MYIVHCLEKINKAFVISKTIAMIIVTMVYPWIHLACVNVMLWLFLFIVVMFIILKKIFVMFLLPILRDFIFEYKRTPCLSVFFFFLFYFFIPFLISPYLLFVYNEW